MTLQLNWQYHSALSYLLLCNWCFNCCNSYRSTEALGYQYYFDTLHTCYQRPETKLLVTILPHRLPHRSGSHCYWQLLACGVPAIARPLLKTAKASTACFTNNSQCYWYRLLLTWTQTLHCHSWFNRPYIIIYFLLLLQLWWCRSNLCQWYMDKTNFILILNSTILMIDSRCYHHPVICLLSHHFIIHAFYLLPIIWLINIIYLFIYLSLSFHHSSYSSFTDTGRSREFLYQHVKTLELLIIKTVHFDYHNVVETLTSYIDTDAIIVEVLLTWLIITFLSGVSYTTHWQFSWHKLLTLSFANDWISDIDATV